ncbi:MAG: DUF4886 domain-containing protein [Clostridia bacterium]|nr:DUF4886 domain-containing protein [Clostridia bacterium]
MKKLLAILLTLILTFSCYSVLCGTVSAEDATADGGKILIASDYHTDSQRWSTYKTVNKVDEDSDGVTDYIQLDGANASYYSYAANLTPGVKYELSFYARVPEGSADYTTSLYPTYAIYLPQVADTTTMKSTSRFTVSATATANNFYAYKNMRHNDFSAVWTVGSQEPVTRTKYSNFDPTDKTKTPNEIYSDWTKVTAVFTACEPTEGDIMPTDTVDNRVALSIMLRGSTYAGLKLDVKDIVLKEYEEATEEPEEPELPEGVIYYEDFENQTDSTVGNVISNLSWAEPYITTTEVKSGEKALGIYAMYEHMFIPFDKTALTEGTIYEFSMDWKLLEYTTDKKRQISKLYFVGYNPSQGETIKDNAVPLAYLADIKGTGDWVNTVLRLRVSDLSAYEQFGIYLRYTTSTPHTEADDTLYLDNLKLQVAEDQSVLTPIELSEAERTEDTIKVLAFGNSFSKDATEFIEELATADGVDLRVGNAWIGGCALLRHYNNMFNGTTDYTFDYHNPETTGGNQTFSKVSMYQALTATDWDYITIQQVSGNSGKIDTFEPYLSELIKYFKEVCPNAEIRLHMTWAYEHEYSGLSNYENSQTVMYESIIDTYLQASKNHGYVRLIPSGEAIQRLRATDAFAEQSLNRDGFHLSDKGRLTAALVWYETFTGISALDAKFDLTTAIGTVSDTVGVNVGVTAEEDYAMRTAAHEAASLYKKANEAQKAIEAIGEVTAESGTAIENANALRTELNNDDLLPNLQTLIDANEAFANLPTEEPTITVRGPEFTESFEDFEVGTKLYDYTLTGTQDMYTYSSKAALLTTFGSLEVVSGGHTGSNSLMGKTYYQYAAMPLNLTPNTEYELSFWYAYTTTNADRYLNEITYGLYVPDPTGKKMVVASGKAGMFKTSKVFAPNNSLAGVWQKATLKFTTGDNVDNLVFAYTYHDKLKSDISATVNKCPLYIDDVSIKCTENVTPKAQITVDTKDAASVEFIGGYFKDFAVGDKVQFKVRTKDNLIPTVSANGTTLTASSNGNYSFVATEENIVSVECEGDENRFDPNVDKQGRPLYEYNEEIAATPVWEGDTVYHETVLFIPGRETAKLLYPIDKVISVRSYDLTMNYLEGVDYEITEDGLLKILDGSKIPVFTKPLETTESSSFPVYGKENTYAAFIGDYDYPAYAITVTYEHTEQWPDAEGYNPETVIQSQKDKIPEVFKKLEKGEEVNIVIFGDSASCGLSTSGLFYDHAIYQKNGSLGSNILNFAPFTPAWPVMLEQNLKKLYPDARITFKNIALGGQTAQWGKGVIKERLGYLERDYGWTNTTPDLMILCFGANDLTAGHTAEEFGSNMQAIIDEFRDYTGTDTEVLLWTQYVTNTSVVQYQPENLMANREQFYTIAENNDGVGIADSMSVFFEVLESKEIYDIFNDNMVHGNDFLTRIIAQCLIAGLSEPEHLAGDINGDGVNNLKDLVVLSQYVAGWENLSVTNDILDVNLDGTVDLTDVSNLAKHLAGWKEVTVKGSFFTEYLNTYHPLVEVQSKLKLNNRATFDGDALRMEWSASGFTVQGQFSGDFILNDVKTIDPETGNTEPVLFYAVLDGGLEYAVQLRTDGKGESVVALEGIKPGFHTVQILKASEAKAVAMTIGGITYNGSLFSAPAEKELKMEFIGDSISSAMGLYTKEAEPDWLLRTDITKGYAIKVADYFNADFNIVSCSNGSVCTEAPYMYDEYQNLYYGNTDVKYDFESRTEPDVVVIALGANDTPAYMAKDENGKTIPAENIDVLKQGITDMLTMVRSKNPNAKIVWVYGMMEVRLASVYENTVKEFAETDGNTYYTLISRHDCNGQGGHPTPDGHTANAADIVDFLKTNVLK